LGRGRSDGFGLSSLLSFVAFRYMFTQRTNERTKKKSSSSRKKSMFARASVSGPKSPGYSRAQLLPSLPSFLLLSTTSTDSDSASIPPFPSIYHLHTPTTTARGDALLLLLASRETPTAPEHSLDFVPPSPPVDPKDPHPLLRPLRFRYNR